MEADSCGAIDALAGNGRIEARVEAAEAALRDRHPHHAEEPGAHRARVADGVQLGEERDRR